MIVCYCLRFMGIQHSYNERGMYVRVKTILLSRTYVSHPHILNAKVPRTLIWQVPVTSQNMTFFSRVPLIDSLY